MIFLIKILVRIHLLHKNNQLNFKYFVLGDFCVFIEEIYVVQQVIVYDVIFPQMSSEINLYEKYYLGKAPQSTSPKVRLLKELPLSKW